MSELKVEEMGTSHGNKEGLDWGETYETREEV